MSIFSLSCYYDLPYLRVCLIAGKGCSHVVDIIVLDGSRSTEQYEVLSHSSGSPFLIKSSHMQAAKLTNRSNCEIVSSNTTDEEDSISGVSRTYSFDESSNDILDANQDDNQDLSWTETEDEDLFSSLLRNYMFNDLETSYAPPLRATANLTVCAEESVSARSNDFHYLSSLRPLPSSFYPCESSFSSNYHNLQGVPGQLPYAESVNWFKGDITSQVIDVIHSQAMQQLMRWSNPAFARGTTPTLKNVGYEQRVETINHLPFVKDDWFVNSTASFHSTNYNDQGCGGIHSGIGKTAFTETTSHKRSVKKSQSKLSKNLSRLAENTRGKSNFRNVTPLEGTPCIANTFDNDHTEGMLFGTQHTSSF